MPIYEFRCEACGAGLEALVGPGSEPTECIECGASGLRRVFSAQAAPHRLAKPPGETRRQERRNGRLREAARSRFKDARARARRAKGADGDR